MMGDKPKFSGIYCIRHRASSKCYVGSACSISNRWSTHRATLNRNKHHCSKLQRAWNKYGAEAFEFEVLEACGLSELAAFEQKWMDELDSVKAGYNEHPEARTARGYKHKIGFRLSMSEVQTRIGVDPEERARRSERARRQHTEKSLGRATWRDPKKTFKPTAAELAASAERMRAHVSAQSSEEMSRRSSARKMFNDPDALALHALKSTGAYQMMRRLERRE